MFSLAFFALALLFALFAVLAAAGGLPWLAGACCVLLTLSVVAGFLSHPRVR